MMQMKTSTSTEVNRLFQ